VKKILILASAAVISGAAFAAPQAPTVKFISTEQLVAMCKNKANPQDQGYCGGFGQGVYDGYLQMVHPKKDRQTICIPQEAKDPGIVEAFLKWAEANPKFSNRPASEAVLNFLDQRYPCGKKK
jgi:Rap1a immunity proteins